MPRCRLGHAAAKQQQFATSATSAPKVNMAQAEKPWKCTNLGLLTFLRGRGRAGAAPNHWKTVVFSSVV